MLVLHIKFQQNEMNFVDLTIRKYSRDMNNFTSNIFRLNKCFLQMVKQIKIISKALWDIVWQQYCGQGMLRYLVLCFYLRG